MKVKISRCLALFVLALMASLLPACDLGGAPAQPATSTSAPSGPAVPTSAAAQPALTAVAILAPTVALPPTGAPSVLSAEPQAVLRGAFARLKSAAYRSKDTTTYTLAGQSQSLETTREFVPPDRTRTIFKPALASFDEVINIGSVQYTKDLSGNWTKFDQPDGISSRTPNVEDIIAKAVSDVQLVGPDLVNGTPSMAYTMKFNLNAGDATFAGTYKVWLAVADGLPRQVDSQGSATAKSGSQTQIQSHNIY